LTRNRKLEIHVDEYGVDRDLGHDIFLFVDRAFRAT
jgi:hypothetical protein